MSYGVLSLKRLYKSKVPCKQRLPVTPSILLKVQSILQFNPTEFDHIMIWAASLVCFFGFLRSGEITISSLSAYDPFVHLNRADIAVNDPNNPTIIQLTIKKSKTDPFRQGVNIFLGATGNTLCPVTALLNYLAIRGESEGPLFHYKDQLRTNLPAHLGTFSTKQVLRAHNIPAIASGSVQPQPQLLTA